MPGPILPVPLTPSLTSPSTSFANERGSAKDTRNPLEAARDFEALLVAHLLRESRASSGWLSSGDDSASDAIAEFAEEQLAQALTRSGGLGLARLVHDGLAAADTKASASPPAVVPHRQAITPPERE
jgi:Rod binding domain-containing protein